MGSRGLLRAVAGGAALGVAGLGYAAGYEVRAFTLRRFTVPVLPLGVRPLRILHISDLHLMPGQKRKLDWLRSLAALEPDLVVNTGDNISHPDSVPVLLDALDRLLEAPGVFVFGSNDYFSPTLRNPVRYLLPDDGQRVTHTPQLPWRELRTGLVDAGWHDLTNRHDSVEIGGLRLAFAGVDDPHLGYDDLASIDERADATADLRIGVAHAPYLRVLDHFAERSYELVLAGHTHGGQLCLPFKGALVTNCDLDTARAKGLHRHGESWLHVSAGAGTSPYAPVRFCCRPEATLLTLQPADR